MWLLEKSNDKTEVCALYFQAFGRKEENDLFRLSETKWHCQKLNRNKYFKGTLHYPILDIVPVLQN